MTDNTLYFDDWRFFVSARFLDCAALFVLEFG